MAIGVLISTGSIAYIILLYLGRNKSRFSTAREVSNRFIEEQRDYVSRWIDNTEKRIQKNDLKINTSKYLWVSLAISATAFVVSIRLLKNLTAPLLVASIMFVVPEYIMSLWEDREKGRAQNQLVAAVKIYGSGMMQKKQIQTIFESISQGVGGRVGKYFGQAYTESVTGTPLDITLANLMEKLDTVHGRMFVQLIYKSQKNRAVAGLLTDLLMRIENTIELGRDNASSIANDRLQAIVLAAFPIPTYLIMNALFPETRIYVTETYPGRLTITLYLLSIILFVILDKQIRKVD